MVNKMFNVLQRLLTTNLICVSFETSPKLTVKLEFMVLFRTASTVSFCIVITICLSEYVRLHPVHSTDIKEAVKDSIALFNSRPDSSLCKYTGVKLTKES